MRLWHQALIRQLPRQQLLGQHRECCALRGQGWGRNHSVVNYVFTHNPAHLVAYHFLIMDEMRNRGYNPTALWYDKDYRGSILGKEDNWCNGTILHTNLSRCEAGINIFPEHDNTYYKECVDNLKNKGIEI